MSDITGYDFGVSKMHVIQDKQTIIVDTGCFTDKEVYAETLSKMGIGPSDVSLIIITHGHWDHFARIHELKELTHAPVLCHKKAVKYLQDGAIPEFKPRGEEGAKFLAALAKLEPDIPKPVMPDIIIDIDSDSDFDLTPYGVAGKLVYTPGHSDCSVSVVLDSGTALVGDLVVASIFTGELLLSTTAADESELRASIHHLLETVHTFYSGHGGPYSKDEILSLL